MSLPNLDLAAVMIILVMGVMFLIVVDAYRRLAAEYEDLKERQKAFEDKGKKKAEEILEGARAESQHILTESHHKAEDVIGEFETFNLQEKEKILAGIKKATLEQMRRFQAELAEEMVKESQKMQALTRENVDKEYERARKEVEEFKQERLRRLEEGIGKVIQDVAYKVLGEVLDMEQHGKLVLKALEEAKDLETFE